MSGYEIKRILDLYIQQKMVIILHLLGLPPPDNNHRWRYIWMALSLFPLTFGAAIHVYFHSNRQGACKYIRDTDWRLYWTVHNFSFVSLFILLYYVLFIHLLIVLCLNSMLSVIFIFYLHSHKFAKYCLRDKCTKQHKMVILSIPVTIYTGLLLNRGGWCELISVCTFSFAAPII